MIKRLLFLAIFAVLLLFLTSTQALAVSKRIEVNLTNQHLYAYQDNQLIYNFPVSTGKWAPTPTGTYYPYVKLRYDRMRGGNQALGTYYDLPNIPYVVYFYQGYSLHGTYWHNNFGHPMSHGCINESISDAALIYNWIDYSTPIIIYGVTPAY